MPAPTKTLLAALIFLGIAVSASPVPPGRAQPPPAAEWRQHAYNAQRTSYAPDAVPYPWRWKWAWNGPDSGGGVAAGKTALPRGVQPVTGGGRVYVARGADGLVALDGGTGAVVWAASPGGAINSTAAYDPDTDAVFVVSANGTLYRLDAASGATTGAFAADGDSPLPLPPALDGGRVFFSMGSAVYAVDKFSMQPVWVYAAGSPVDTPPAYSPSRDLVIVAARDLYVHAIANATGQRRWRVRHTPLAPGDPADENPYAEVSYGWPVLAEAHGYALVKLRLNWMTLWQTYPPDNEAIRQFLAANPDQQALLVIDLDDGSQPFIANVSHGGFGNGGYIPMGFQPAVRLFDDGSEVAYVLARGETRYDPRWDSHLGELVLDDSTADGFLPGYFRYIDFAGTTLGDGDVFLTDEQPFVSAAGDYVFANHWEASMYSLRITDRGQQRGAYDSRIQTETLPTLIESQDAGGCGSAHFTTGPLANTRPYPNPRGGFHIFCNQGAIFDTYWSGYGATVISGGLLLTVSTSGVIVALEHANQG